MPLDGESLLHAKCSRLSWRGILLLAVVASIIRNDSHSDNVVPRTTSIPRIQRKESLVSLFFIAILLKKKLAFERFWLYKALLTEWIGLIGMPDDS